MESREKEKQRCEIERERRTATLTRHGAKSRKRNHCSREVEREKGRDMSMRRFAAA